MKWNQGPSEKPIEIHTVPINNRPLSLSLSTGYVLIRGAACVRSCVLGTTALPLPPSLCLFSVGRSRESRPGTGKTEHRFPLALSPSLLAAVCSIAQERQRMGSGEGGGEGEGRGDPL